MKSTLSRLFQIKSATYIILKVYFDSYISKLAKFSWYNLDSSFNFQSLGKLWWNPLQPPQPRSHRLQLGVVHSSESQLMHLVAQTNCWNSRRKIVFFHKINIYKFCFKSKYLKNKSATQKNCSIFLAHDKYN